MSEEDASPQIYFCFNYDEKLFCNLKNSRLKFNYYEKLHFLAKKGKLNLSIILNQERENISVNNKNNNRFNF